MKPLLIEHPELQVQPLQPPASKRLRVPREDTGQTVARIWNMYGGFLSALAERLTVGPGVAAAILSVESAGEGFSDDGRMIIRFENHVFQTQLGPNQASVYQSHFKHDPRQAWTNHQYRPTPAGRWIKCHASQTREWDVFHFASTIDEAAATQSISMGAPQIMGFNHQAIGYPTARAIFDELGRDIRPQIAGMFDYVRARGPQAVEAMRRRDFFTFAGHYNGFSDQQPVYRDLLNRAFDAFERLQGGAVGSAPSPTYVVRSGDTLSAIAKRFKTTTREIAELNQLADLNRIRVGDLLLIVRPAVVLAPEESADPATPRGRTSVYVVRPGDTLSRIAAAFNTTTDALARLNAIANPDSISAGQRLRIPR